MVNDHVNTNYGARNEIIWNTEVLTVNLCHYIDAYIFVRGDIAVVGIHATQVAFKNSAPFTDCVTKIGRTTVDGAKDFELVMPISNFSENSPNYFDTQ